MPRNGSGTFSPYTPGNPVVTATVVSSTVHNNTVNDIGSEITNSIARDGQSPPTANLPMGGFKHTGVGAANASGQYVEFAQLSSSARTYTGQQGFGQTALTDGANIAWNLATNQCARVTLGGNRTLDNPTNIIDGFTYTLVVTQDGTGSRTLAYGSNYLFPSGVDPILSTAAGAIDVLTFIGHNSKLLGVAQKAFA